MKKAKSKLEKEVQRIINRNAKGYGSVEKYINDLLDSGCISGMVDKMIRYKDTTAFYRRHKDEIWDLVLYMTKAGGHSNPFEFLSTLNGANNVKGHDLFANLLAWFAFEETARNLLERR